jgi:hypothetical protein
MSERTTKPGRWIRFGLAAFLSVLWPGGLRAQPGAPTDLGKIEFLRSSDDYRVWINGKERFVFKSLKTGNHGSHDIKSMSFASFDLNQPVEVKVEPKTKVRSFAVRPYNAKITAQLDGNVISFKLDQPRHVVVTVNDSYDPVLVLSAQPPHTPPKPADVQHYFAPGVHDIGRNKLLVSGDKVYLAEGAIVKGSFGMSNVSNVSITGRGIIYNGHYPHEEAFRVFKGDTTRDVLIEGVTVTHSPGWIVSFWNGNTNLTVRNVVMVGNWWMNSDGVQTGTDGLVVENCFLQCNDDNFSLNGVCKNVVIRDNVLWNLFNGGVFMLGWATGTQFDLQNLDIRDNVVFRAGGCCDYDRKAPISMKLFGWARTAQDIRIRNLVIEDLAPYGRWLDLQAEKASRSTLRDFTFENISVLKTWKVEGEVRGNANACRFENLTFTNITIAGKLMLTPADGGLNLINTTNVRINGTRFGDVISAASDPGLARTANSGDNNSGRSIARVGPNLLAHPGFANGLGAWKTRGPNAVEVVAAPGLAAGALALRLSKRNGGASVELDVTEILREQGTGNYTWAATVRGGATKLPVKATLVIEDEAGVQQHPAPDVEVTADTWSQTERRTPLQWTNLQRAAFRVESNWGADGTFYLHECWLSR